MSQRTTSAEASSAAEVAATDPEQDHNIVVGNSAFRNKMVALLRDKSPGSCEELQDLLKMDEAALRLLDVLNCCPEDLLLEVVLLLKTVWARDKRKRRLDTGAEIWCNLSSVLSCLTTPAWEKRWKNICCVICVACKVVPHSPNITLMLRLTQQLVRIFQTICGKTWEETLSNTKSAKTQLLLSQLFKLTHTIVYKMNVANDLRGLKIFLEEDSLRRALLASLDSDFKTVTHHTINLLTYLVDSQKLYNIQIKNTRNVMGAELLLQLMSTNGAQTAFFTAKVFSDARILGVDWKIFITLPSEMSNTTIQTLYLEFQNFTVTPGVESSLGWRNKSRLMKYCRQHNPLMEQHLLTQPFNELALQVAFKKNEGIKDAHLAEYLHTYMMGARAHKMVSHRSYARALFRDPVSTILTIVAEQLLTKDWPSGSLHSQLIYQICTIGGNIPQETINALKVKMTRHNNKFGRQ